jgi:hypothetical protein
VCHSSSTKEQKQSQSDMMMISETMKRLETELEAAGLLTKFYRRGARALRDEAILKCVGQNRTNYLGIQYILKKKIENAPHVIMYMYARAVSKKLLLKKYAAYRAPAEAPLLDIIDIDAFFALKFNKDAMKEKTIAKIAKKLKTTDLDHAKREMAHYVNIYKKSNSLAM